MWLVFASDRIRMEGTELCELSVTFIARGVASGAAILMYAASGNVEVKMRKNSATAAQRDESYYLNVSPEGLIAHASRLSSFGVIKRRK